MDDDFQKLLDAVIEADIKARYPNGRAEAYERLELLGSVHGMDMTTPLDQKTVHYWRNPRWHR